MSRYHWNAKDYEDNSKAQQKWARELIAKLNLKGSEDILDLGCGDGKVTAEIACAVANGSVVGVDSSEPMIALARQKYPQKENRNLSFEVMDATRLSFKERFDVVFSNAALHWVKEHEPVVEGLYRSLRSGGKILLQMRGEGNAAAILCVLEALQRSNEWSGYFAGFEFPYGFLGIEEYKRLLDKSGFGIERVELIPKDMEHDGRLGLEGWVRTTWLPYTQRIPEEKRDRFVEALVSAYLEKVPLDQEGKAHVAMVRIEVEATKP